MKLPKKLPYIRKYSQVFIAFGIAILCSLFIGEVISGIALIMLGIWNFFAVWYSNSNKRKLNRNRRKQNGKVK